MMIKYSDQDVSKKLNGTSYKSKEELKTCCIVKFNAMVEKGIKEFGCPECGNKISLE